MAWVRGLAALRPDVVVDTGDNLSFANGLEPLERALEPFLDLPGAFVLGDHDYRTTIFKLPTRYLRSTRGRSTRISMRSMWRCPGARCATCRLREAGRT